MIGDLTSSPEPIEIKLFSQDPDLLEAVGAARSARRIKKIQGRRRRQGRHREHHQRTRRRDHGRSRSSRRAPASRRRRSSSTPARFCRANPPPRRWSSTTAPTPSASASRPTRARRSMQIQQHHDHQLDRQDRHARLAGRFSERGRARPKSAARICSAIVAVTGRFEGVSLGTGIATRAEGRRRSAPAARHPRGVRRHLRRAAEVVPRSAASCWRSPSFWSSSCCCSSSALRRARRDPRVGAALHLRRVPRAAGHRNDVQHLVVHGPDHGHRHRRQERHSAARCRPALPRRRIFRARTP